MGDGNGKNPNNNSGRLVKKDGKWQWISESNCLPKDLNIEHGTVQGNPHHSKRFPFKSIRVNSHLSVEKNATSIFVTNLPWNASVKEIWDICKQWGLVVDVFVASKKAKNGARFGFVRFKNVSDVPLLIKNLRTVWMGKFHIFADLARFSRNGKPTGSPSGPNLNPPVAPKTNKSMPMVNANMDSGFQKSFAEVVSNISKPESQPPNSPNLVDTDFVIQEDDCMDYLGVHHSILAKVRDIMVINDIIKHAKVDGFLDVALRYIGGRWVWLEFVNLEQLDSFQKSPHMLSFFDEFRQVSPDFISDERCVWLDIVGLPLATWSPNVLKKLATRWGSCVVVDMDNDGPLAHGKICVLTHALTRIQETLKVSYRDRLFEVAATEFAYWVPEFENSEDGSSSSDDEVGFESQDNECVDDLQDSFDSSDSQDGLSKNDNTIEHLYKTVDIRDSEDILSDLNGGTDANVEELEQGEIREELNQGGEEVLDTIKGDIPTGGDANNGNDMVSGDSKLDGTVGSNVSTPPGFQGAPKAVGTVRLFPGFKKVGSTGDASSGVNGNSIPGYSIMDSPSANIARLKHLGSIFGLELPADDGELSKVYKGLRGGGFFK